MLSFSTQRLSTAILLLVSSCSVYSLPASHDTTSTASLANTVPNCAFECTEKLIEMQWPKSVCSDRSEINCFCKTNTASGYTLGEIVLGCMLSFCPQDVISASSSVGYSICKGVAGAVPNTHSTLTATLMTETSSPTAGTVTSSSSSDMTSSVESTSSLSETSTTSPTLSSIITSTLPHITTFQSPVGTGTEPVTPALSSDATASSSPTPTPGGGGDSNSLNAGSVVGVSVVSGLSGFFLVGVAIFFCYRKLKSKRREGKGRDYFEIGGVMSEPLGFGDIPPRRPTPRPKPPPKPANQDTETSRLMSPFERRPGPPNPAVVVTEADDGDHGDDGRRDVGRTLPNLDMKDSPQMFYTYPRTPSDLSPDKPEYGLYPEPLRWDRKYSRPASETTTFEEDVSRPRSFPSHGYSNFSGLIGPRPYIPRRLIPGLPANPRAMLQGFGPRDPSPPKRSRSQDNLTKPVYLNPEPKTQFSFDAVDGDQTSHHTRPQSFHAGDYVDDYWQGSGNSQPQVGLPSSRFYGQAINQRQPEENPNTGFETIDIHRGPESHRASRHSGFIRPLTPVREVSTPTRNLPSNNIPDRIGYSNGSPPERTPRIPVTPDPAREIVSRPRIVRQHDIKRVEIRRGKPPQHQQQQSKESIMPYSPEDYWPESSRCSATLDGSCTSATPATSSRLSGGFGYPVEKTITRKPANRESPLEHNLTPSRRGGDLILRVDAF